MLNVTVTYPLNKSDVDKLQDIFKDKCRFSLEENFDKCDVIWGNPSDEQLKLSEGLKWVQIATAGINQYTEGNLPKNVILTNASGAHSLQISEYMLSVHLALYQNLPCYINNMQKSKWEETGVSRNIYGSTVVVLGLGNIGSEYAKRVKMMGAYVIAVKKNKTEKPDYVDELYTIDEINSALPRADMLAVTLPGTKTTYKLVNKEMLSYLKQGALVINVGRGTVVDGQDLLDALESGSISGAALDVTDPEPLPKESKLWGMKNLIITPHISGGFVHPFSRKNIIDIFVNNLHRYINNEPLKNIVSIKEGY